MEKPEQPDYSQETFWSKLANYAVAAGREVVELALQLYYALQAPKTPKWAKAVIVGALAYFIFPLDAIPDAIPAMGYTDDLGALAAAVATVHMYITDDIKSMAKEKIKQWFGERS